MYRRIPLTIKKFASLFHSHKFEIFLVGGAVRNMVLNKKPQDWDFATNALPQQLLPLFKKVIPTGIDHGTITILFEGHSFEVTTFRVDGDYSDNRRPDRVTFSPSILEDLSRRDFTMNAMAIDLRDGSLLDPHNGRNDIKRKLIRTVGLPGDRFREDALRIMRAVRFASQLGFNLEEKAEIEVRSLSTTLSRVSVERFREEFVKILFSDHVFEGLNLGLDLGVFDYWIPELKETLTFIDERSGLSLASHLFATAGYLRSTGDLSLILAGLFHDIAKPQTKTEQENLKVHFPSHDTIGAIKASEILRRLKFSNDVVDLSSKLVEHHMFNSDITESPRALRRFIARVGFENTLKLISLRYADLQANTLRSWNVEGIKIEELRILEFRLRETYLDKRNVFGLKDLNIDGTVLQSEVGVPKGKVIGSILNELLEVVLDNPEENNLDRLIELSRKIYESRWHPLEGS